MKKILVILTSLFTLKSQSQILFSYGKKQVTKQEFLAAFNKNPTPANERKQSLDEYRILYPI